MGGKLKLILLILELFLRNFPLLQHKRIFERIFRIIKRQSRRVEIILDFY